MLVAFDTWYAYCRCWPTLYPQHVSWQFLTPALHAELAINCPLTLPWSLDMPWLSMSLCWHWAARRCCAQICPKTLWWRTSERTCGTDESASELMYIYIYSIVNTEIHTYRYIWYIYALPGHRFTHFRMIWCFAHERLLLFGGRYDIKQYGICFNQVLSWYKSTDQLRSVPFFHCFSNFLFP